MADIFSFDSVDSDQRTGPRSYNLNSSTEFPDLTSVRVGRSQPASRPTTPFSVWSGVRAPSPLAPSGSAVLHTPTPRAPLAQGHLAALLPKSTTSSRATSDASDIVNECRAEAQVAKKKKKSKKGRKNGTNGKSITFSTAGLEKPDYMTPQKQKAVYAQSVKDEDWTFVKRPTPSPAPTSSSRESSPPPRSGLSSLLNQAHPGDLITVQGSETSASSESGEVETMCSYEVALDQDYVDREVDSRPASRAGTVVGQRKKMTTDDFESLRCLGKGSFGTVYLVRHLASGRLYAQKQLKKASIHVHKRIIEQTKTERSILESVRHPNICKLYYAFQDSQKLYLILEYASGGELFHHLAEQRMFTEDKAAFYLAQLVLALAHLHLNAGIRIVYRDLKPENCLLDSEGHLLLTDFGLSKVRTDDSHCRSLCGTAAYMAPEVLMGDGEVDYGPEVDWWGVGILAHELLTGSAPWESSSPQVIKNKIMKGKLTLPWYLSADAKDLITRFLRKEPRKRLGHNLPKDLDIIKKHRFFRKIDWKLLERREMEPPIRPLVTDPALAENFDEEFTSLPLSPTVESGFDILKRKDSGSCGDSDPFGGFSYVATSLLEKSFLTGDW